MREESGLEADGRPAPPPTGGGEEDAHGAIVVPLAVSRRGEAAGRGRSRPVAPGEAALGRQLHAMSTLLLFNEGVAAERPHAELLERLTAELPAMLEARGVALLVVDPDCDRLSLYWAPAGRGRAERHALAAVTLERLRETGSSEAWVELLDALPAHVRRELTAVPPARLRVTPVRHRDRLLGLLVACPGTGRAPRGSWAWHQVVARNVATATHRVRRHRELLQRAYYDPLTGLPNRSLFHDRLQQAVARARRTSRRLAVLYLDLDDFKWVNDTLGHHAGDELLRRMAAVLTSALRETDTVGRLSGDEFAIVLPDVGDARQIDAVLATLRARLQAPVRIAGQELKLRASIGVAVFPVHAADADALLRSADAAMYRVKRARALRRRPAGPPADAPDVADRPA
jgi:diguanylate cyclase (GGDEF)-like protein